MPAASVNRHRAGLIDQRPLITTPRPRSTATDPLAHQLTTLGAAGTATVAEPMAKPREVASGPAWHHHAGPANAQETRAEAAVTRGLGPASGPALSVDPRPDAQVTLPVPVGAGATGAAAALIRLSGRSALSRGWVAWHGSLPGALRPARLGPLLDAVDGDTGLGSPAGSLSGPPAPAKAAVSERDVRLLTLAQHAALRHPQAVVRADAMVSDLAGTRPDGRLQPTTEVTARTAATGVRALDPRGSPWPSSETLGPPGR